MNYTHTQKQYTYAQKAVMMIATAYVFFIPDYGFRLAAAIATLSLMAITFKYLKSE